MPWRQTVNRSRIAAIVASIALAFTLSFLSVSAYITSNETRRMIEPQGAPASQAAPMVSSPAATTPPAVPADMFASFRPANADELAAIASLPDLKDEPAAKKVYVAMEPFTLTWHDEPFLLIVPQGIKWVAGPQGNVVFLKITSPQVTTQSITVGGTLYSDPMCELKRLGVFVGDCTSSEARKAASWDEMMTHLRRPTLEELKSFVEPEFYASADPKDYLIATSDFRVAPEYRMWDVPGNISGILVPRGITVLGGQLGYIDIMTAPGHTALDTICFMYDADPATGPRAFVSEAELKRVEQGCKR